MEALGHTGQRGADLVQELGRDRGLAAAVVARGDREAGPGAFEPVGLVRAIALRGLEIALEPGEEVGGDRIDLGGGQEALVDQAAGIDLAHGRMAMRWRGTSAAG